MTFLNVNTEPRGRRAGRHPHRRGHDRQPGPDPAGAGMSGIASAPASARGARLTAAGRWRRPVPGPAADPADRPARSAGRSSWGSSSPTIIKPGWVGVTLRAAIPLAILGGMPDAHVPDRRHRPLRRRRRLDVRLRRRDARRRPGSGRGRARRTRHRGARGLHHGRRRGRVQGPPADHDPGHEPGRPRPRERLAADHGPDRIWRARRRAAGSGPA